MRKCLVAIQLFVTSVNLYRESEVCHVHELDLNSLAMS